MHAESRATHGDLTGCWCAVGDDRRRLVFRADGTGHIEVEGDVFPHFRWDTDGPGPEWQFFHDASHSRPVSARHAMAFRAEVVERQRTIAFRVAPIPFGFRVFRHAGIAPA